MEDPYEPRDHPRRRRSDFLRLMAHDLYNPLTAIRILAEMIQEETESAQIRDDTSGIIEATDLATALVGGMSSLAHLETGLSGIAMDRIDLAPVVYRVVSRHALQGQVSAVLPVSMWIQGNVRALERAFTDILINACRLSPHRVQVTAILRDDCHLLTVPGFCERVAPELRPWLLTYGGAIELRRASVPISASGLSYTTYTIEAHGGSLSLAPDGVTLVAQLPSAPPS